MTKLVPTTIRSTPSEQERRIAKALAFVAFRAQWVTVDDIERGAHLVAGALASAFQQGVTHALKTLAEQGR